MRTISQPVAKSRIFWVRDMPRLGFDSGSEEPFEWICESEFALVVSDGMDMESRKKEL